MSWSKLTQRPFRPFGAEQIAAVGRQAQQPGADPVLATELVLIAAACEADLARPGSGDPAKEALTAARLEPNVRAVYQVAREGRLPEPDLPAGEALYRRLAPAVGSLLLAATGTEARGLFNGHWVQLRFPQQRERLGKLIDDLAAPDKQLSPQIQAAAYLLMGKTCLAGVMREQAVAFRRYIVGLVEGQQQAFLRMYLTVATNAGLYEAFAANLQRLLDDKFGASAADAERLLTAALFAQRWDVYRSGTSASRVGLRDKMIELLNEGQIDEARTSLQEAYTRHRKQFDPVVVEGLVNPPEPVRVPAMAAAAPPPGLHTRNIAAEVAAVDYCTTNLSLSPEEIADRGQALVGCVVAALEGGGANPLGPYAFLYIGAYKRASMVIEGRGYYADSLPNGLDIRAETSKLRKNYRLHPAVILAGIARGDLAVIARGVARKDDKHDDACSIAERYTAERALGAGRPIAAGLASADGQ